MGHEISKNNSSVKKTSLPQKKRWSRASVIFDSIIIDRRSIDISDEEYDDMKEAIRQVCKPTEYFMGI